MKLIIKNKKGDIISKYNYINYPSSVEIKKKVKIFLDNEKLDVCYFKILGQATLEIDKSCCLFG